MNDLAYQEMIYNKLLALDAKMARIFPYTDTTPQLKGGTRARSHPLPGITMETYEPATLSVGGKIKDARYRGPPKQFDPPIRKNTVITSLHGGAKRTSPWIQFVKEFSAKHGIPYNQALKQAGEEYRKLEGGKKVNRLKKAKRWTGFVKDTLNTGMDLADRGASLVKKHGGGVEDELEGGRKKVNRLKKAKRWTGFVKDTLNTGMDLADRGASLVKKHGGGVEDELEGGRKKINRLKKAKRWTGFVKDTLNTGMDLADRGATLVKKHGGVVKPINKALKQKKHDIFVRDRAQVEKGFKEKIIPMTLGVKDFYVDLGKKVVKKVKGGSRAPSQWIQFVKEFSAKHKIPYNQALKLAGPEYRKIKA